MIWAKINSTNSRQFRSQTARKAAMSPRDDQQSIKITLDDLKSVSTPGEVAEKAAPAIAPAAAKSYGNIAEAVEESVSSPQARPNILLQAWFYLGAAGLVGALLAW